MDKYYDEHGIGFDLINEDGWTRDETLLNLARLFEFLED